MNKEIFNPNENQPDEEFGDMFSSLDQRRAISEVTSSSLDSKIAINHKKRSVKEITEEALLSPEIMKSGATIYVASGTDIAYPLLIGARKIVMVDPILQDDKTKQEIINRITAIINQPPEIIDNRLEFQFDFGNGDENVSVILQAAVYGSEKTYGRLVPSEKDQELERQEFLSKLHKYEQQGLLDRIIAGEWPEDENGEMIMITPQVAQRFKNRQGEFAPDLIPPKSYMPPHFENNEPVSLILGFRTTGINLLDDKNTTNYLLKGAYTLVDHLEPYNEDEFEKIDIYTEGVLLRKK